MFTAISVIVGGSFIDDYLEHNTGIYEYTADMYQISEAAATRFDTTAGKSVMIDRYFLTELFKTFLKNNCFY